MSITTTHPVFCDVHGPACVSWVAQTVEGPRAARAEAKAAGWKRTKTTDGTIDVCPPCQFYQPVCSWCGGNLIYRTGPCRWYHLSYDDDCGRRHPHTVPIEAAT